MKRSRLYRESVKRVSKTKQLKKFNQIVGLVIIGAFIGISLSVPAFRPKTIAPEPLSQTKIETKQVIAEQFPTEPIETRIITPIIYLRERGQFLGYSDYQITKIISTMKCESGLRPDAINKNTNGTFDLGVGQINDVHSKRISREDRMDFIKNINFIYQLYSEQGLNPWVCARKLGYTK